MDPPVVDGGAVKNKSLRHASFLDATDDAWIQSHTSSGSDPQKGTTLLTQPEKQIEEVPDREQILTAESSFDAPFEDKEEGGDERRERTSSIANNQIMEPGQVVSVKTNTYGTQHRSR